MSIVEISAHTEPQELRAYMKNEALLSLTFESKDSSRILWCESEIHVENPLSLAPDKELLVGKARVGIIKPNGKVSKQVKLYTRPNNFPDDYKYSIVLYAYDEDGAIAERIEYSNAIKCAENGPKI
ncbi:MAG: hypothetical protein QXW10_00470 [Candidatus Micrarchaeaceae archaeon]